MSAPRIKLSVHDLSVRYGDKSALDQISVDVPDHSVLSVIGPSGCGKTTFLRCFNRMNDLVDGAATSGQILLEGIDIHSDDIDPSLLRARVGMVFQDPNPFPKSIYENVAYGPRLHGMAASRADLDEIVQFSLERVGLWDEVRDDLQQSATTLSGGQQQRLVIARALAINPEVILMDEPCSALDPIATARIEELIDDLRMNYCILVVTHSMSQAARISQNTIFLDKGKLIEHGPTEQIFTNPRDPRTHDYITRRYG